MIMDSYRESNRVSQGSGIVTVKRTSNEVRICVRGPFTHALRQEFRKAYFSYPANCHYVVDLSEVTMMDSSAMGMLLILRNHAGGENANITLANLSARMTNLIKASGMQSIFDVW